MFVTEIGEQPAALRDALGAYGAGEGAATLDRLADLYRTLDSGGRAPVLFTGMGSSLYAAEGALSRLAAGGIPAHLWEAGEWLHYGGDLPASAALVVAISQSGESVETRELTGRLSGRVPVVAVTNYPDSSMARAAEIVLPLHAGVEEMISTRTYTNSLGVLHLAAAALLGEDRGATLAALEAAAGAMERAGDAAHEPRVRAGAAALDGARAIHAIARGPALAAAREGALVLGEGAHLAVTALPAGSFRHGPIELAGPDHAAIVFAPAGPTRPLIDRLAAELAEAGSHVILVCDEPAPPAAANLTALRVVGSPGEPYFSLPAAILVERLLAAVADRRGLVPGRFRFSGKITERE
jgi:glucosamine--fructose-6-phosphate aminotransferase (isomerizing)